jgi:hypothetical protein
MDVGAIWDGWYAAPAPFGRTNFSLKILEATGLIFCFNSLLTHIQIVFVVLIKVHTGTGATIMTWI